MKNFILIVLILFNTNLYSAVVNVDSLVQRLIVIDDSIVKVDLLNRIASEYIPVNYDKSIYFSNEALVLSRKINYSEGISNSLNSISYSHYYRSNYTKAMENYLMKVHFDDSLGLQDRVALSLKQIGNIYFHIQDNSQALKYYNNSLDIFKDIQDTNGLADVYTNLGNIYESKKEIEKAEQLYLMALDIYQKFNDTEAITIIYNNLGNFYYKHYKNSKALKYFVIAKNYLSKVDDMTIHVLVYNNYGDYHLWLNNIDSATYYLKKGYLIAEKYSIPLYKCDIASSLGTIYAQEKDFENAYKYQIISKCLNDSLFNSSLSSKLVFLDYKFNLERIKNLNTIEKLKQQKKNKTRLWISILAIIFTSVLIFVVAIYYKHKIKTEKLSKEKLNLESRCLQEQIEFKNKEIVIIMMNLFERNELIRSVIQKLKAINLSLKRTEQKSIEGIIHELKSQYQENILKEFEHRFLNVHNNFYKSMIRDYPSLTSNDLRLCAFLKMNMNTKDIAILTHQNANSIEVARTRLRKKLSINNSDIDLAMFLSKF